VYRRRLSQLFFAVFLNFPLLGQWKSLCVPILNCHSCPWAAFACPVGVIGHLVSWSVFPFLALGTILLLGALFGRLLCGWVCPFGFLQDLLHKVPIRKIHLPRRLSLLKYVVLVVMVVVVPLLIGVESNAFFCSLCPAATIQAVVPWGLMGGKNLIEIVAGTWIRFVVLAIIVLLAMTSRRSFCRFLCPIGAFLALCNRFSVFSLRYAQNDCPRCKRCLKDCPMDVQIEDFERKGQTTVVTAPSECILCLNCTKNCHKSSLRWTLWNLFPKVKDHASVKESENHV